MTEYQPGDVVTGFGLSKQTPFEALKYLVAVYPTKVEALAEVWKLSTGSVFYSDGSYRAVGWEIWQ